MKGSFKNCLSLSFILMGHLTGSAKTLSLSEDKTVPSLRLNVRVFNYAEVSPETWNLAQEVAARILHRTGLETHWLKCSLSSEGKLIPAVCEQPAEPSDLVLRLVPVSAATRAQFGYGTLGIAAQPEKGTHASASIFYDRVEQLARGGDATRAVILGHAIAHELGHLLLGSNSHSPMGLMRAKWSRQDLRLATIGELLFTRSEAISLRQNIIGCIRKASILKKASGGAECENWVGCYRDGDQSPTLDVEKLPAITAPTGASPPLRETLSFPVPSGNPTIKISLLPNSSEEYVKLLANYGGQSFLLIESTGRVIV